MTRAKRPLSDPISGDGRGSATSLGMAKRTRLIHFVGIGGIGMSGIAEVLLNLGYEVRGSDLRASETTRRLVDLGGDVRFGHEEQHVEGADVVVVSSAITKDNPEVRAARRAKIPVIRRAEMLAELMRLKFGIAIGGTHGKTTTTSLVATMLTTVRLDPTVVVGGKLNKLGSNAVLGQGPYLVAEADESDGSFLQLSPTIAVVTNIDAEHLDHYSGGFEELRSAFISFVNRVPFYGLAILCVDHPGVQSILPDVEKRFVTYGLTAQAEIRAQDVRYDGPMTSFELIKRGEPCGKVELAMIGEHNVQNALAALAVADELGVADDKALSALSEFDGVDRRFTVRGEIGEVLVVDDYGHHPTEITATLKGARRAYPGRRLVIAFQPHRYTRTRDLLDQFSTSFNEADVLFVCPIYAASEEPIEGIDSARLIEAIRKHGHRDVRALADVGGAAHALAEEAEAGDVIIAFGAGDIGRVGQELVLELSSRAEMGGQA